MIEVDLVQVNHQTQQVEIQRPQQQVQDVAGGLRLDILRLRSSGGIGGGLADRNGHRLLDGVGRRPLLSISPVKVPLATSLPFSTANLVIL